MVRAVSSQRSSSTKQLKIKAPPENKTVIRVSRKNSQSVTVENFFRAESNPCRSNVSVRIGTNTEPKAPSPRIRRNIFGIIQA